MSTRRGRLVSALVLLAGPVIVAAPAGAVEEIVRMETTVVDCQDMLQGSLGCKRYTHAYTTINPNETKADERSPSTPRRRSTSGSRR
jgi:hypothetical protein